MKSGLRFARSGQNETHLQRYDRSREKEEE